MTAGTAKASGRVNYALQLLCSLGGGTCRGPLGGADKSFLLVPLMGFVLDSGIGGLQNHHPCPTAPCSCLTGRPGKGEGLTLTLSRQGLHTSLGRTLLDSDSLSLQRGHLPLQTSCWH